MAREYGVLHKKYRSQLRRCAISGLRFYQDEMVQVSHGRYVHPKYLDEDYRAKGRIPGGGAGEVDRYTDRMGRALIIARPYATPLAARCLGEMVSLIVGGEY